MDVLQSAGILANEDDSNSGILKPSAGVVLPTSATVRMASFIPGVSEFGFSYEFNFLHSVFLRAEASTMGYKIKLDNAGLLATAGDKEELEKVENIKLDGYTGKILLGYFLSPSISVYGGASKSWFDMKVNTTTIELEGNNPLNQSFYIGLKINL
jgi:hypothetical protein